MMVFRQAIGNIIRPMYYPCAYRRRRKRLTECRYNVSFHDFIQYLIDPELEAYQRNFNWGSNFEICNPRVVKCDIFGRYETLWSVFLKAENDNFSPPSFQE